MTEKTVLVLVVTLGLVALAGTLGIIALAAEDKAVSPALSAIVGTCLGTVSGLLVRPGRNGNGAPTASPKSGSHHGTNSPH